MGNKGKGRPRPQPHTLTIQYLPESGDKVRDCYYLLCGGSIRTRNAINDLMSPMNWMEKIVNQCHQHRGKLFSWDDDFSGLYLFFSFNFKFKLNRYVEFSKSHSRIKPPIGHRNCVTGTNKLFPIGFTTHRCSCSYWFFNKQFDRFLHRDIQCDDNAIW